MIKLTLAQRNAISILIDSEDAQVVAAREQGDLRTSPWQYTISNGTDYLRLHYKTFDWLKDNEIIAAGLLMSINSEIYLHYPTSKASELAKQHNIKKYSDNQFKPT